MTTVYYPITTSLKIIKPPQWVKELIKGVTPSSPPPSFVAIPTLEFSPTIESKDIKLTKLGSADLTKTIEDAVDYALAITYAPIDATLLESMISHPSDSFTFLISQQHDAGDNTLAEMYQILKGCCISSIGISITSGEFVTITSEWFATSMNDWSTNHSLTSPVFASELITVPWSALTTGASPLTFNGASYDIDSFSCTINHNTERLRLLTQDRHTRIDPRVREISIDEIAVVYKDNVISEDVKTLTPRSLLMNLHQQGEDFITLAFEDVYLESYDETVDAESTDAKVISYSGYAAQVSLQITHVPVAVERALATEIIPISESIARIKAKNVTRTLTTETITVSAGTSTKLAAKKRVGLETISISENVTITVTTTGNFSSSNFDANNFKT